MSSPRDPQVARAPLAVVRPTSSAVDEFGSETSDPVAGPPSAPKQEGDGEHVAKPGGLSPVAPSGSAYLASPPNGVSPWSFVNVKWVSAIVAAGLVTGLVWTLGVPAWRARSVGRLTIESVPAGAEVVVDDRVRGTTPVELELPAGTSKIVVRAGRTERVLSVQLKGGDVVRQLIELAPATAATAQTTGTLEVTSDPTRVPLLVDGVSVGATPLSPTTLAAGEHVLSARFPSGPVERRVRVEAGRTTTLHVVSPSATTDSIVGWLSVDTTLPMRIFEDGRLLGTTDVNRVMLPVGTHALHFVSDETGFETDRTVTVSAGRPTALRIETPTATLSVNARPWAEVFIDGERIGETPIGNLSRPIGRHEVVLRHPELGERRQTVVLTTRAPSRVSVDFQARTQ
jgi:hypothetical protein